MLSFNAKSSFVGFGFLIGMAVAFLVSAIIKYDNKLGKSKDDWLVCKYVNMNIIADAVRAYDETNAAHSPVTLQTLVRAKLLPEWSEIYICPGQFGVPNIRSNYDESFFSNTFTSSGLAANYAHGPYYIETLSDSFRVRCLYHTNVLDVTIPRKSERN